MNKINHTSSIIKRKKRVRAKVRGTQDVPRISVFRSNKHLYAQAIDDQSGKTLAASNSLQLDVKKKSQLSEEIAIDLAKKLKVKKIAKAKFDRGLFAYHGKVKAIAEIIRQQGIRI